jgi:arginine:ornithine antiporter/lysine permease
MVVGSGIFSLPRTFGTATGPFGAIIAWTIAGTGMYMLAGVLAEKGPDIYCHWIGPNQSSSGPMSDKG